MLNGSDAKAYIFIERRSNVKAGRSCLVWHEGTNENKKIIVGLILIDDFEKLYGLFKNNSLNSYTANFTVDDNPWLIFRNNYFWIERTFFIILFLFVGGLAVIRLFYTFRSSSYGTKTIIQKICLIIIVIENVIRSFYFIVGPLFFYEEIPARTNTFFFSITWPLSLFNIILITNFWRTILYYFRHEDIIKFDLSLRKGFCSLELGIPWIVLCSVLLIINVIFYISVVTASYDVILLLLGVDVAVHVIIEILTFVYIIIITCDLKFNMAKRAQVANGRLQSFDHLTNVIFLANFGILLNIVGMLIAGINWNELAYTLLTPILLYLGQVFTDFCIINCFNIVERNDDL